MICSSLNRKMLTERSPEKRRRFRRWKRWLLGIVAVYVAGGIALWAFQDKLLFRPVVLEQDYTFNFATPFEEINLPVTEEKNLNIIQFKVPDSLTRGIVLFFHGNRENVERYAPAVQEFVKHNYEVWMPDYPGFGKSTGERTEQIMYDDAALLFKMAKSVMNPDSIIIYGRSMGTGVAAHLASRVDCRRLLLEAPYYSMHALMQHYAFIYPVSWIAKYEFPTYAYLPEVDAPITIFHGTSDEVIPYSHAVRLAKVKPGIQLITIKDGGHNDISTTPDYLAQLDAMLK